jgi:hypothetical protein
MIRKLHFLKGLSVLNQLETGIVPGDEKEGDITDLPPW